MSPSAISEVDSNQDGSNVRLDMNREEGVVLRKIKDWMKDYNLEIFKKVRLFNVIKGTSKR